MGGSLTWEELDSIFKLYDDMGRYSYRNVIKTFVETGTYKGETTRMVSKHFDEVHTFELNEELYKYSIFMGMQEKCGNIHYYNGDSVEFLNITMPYLGLKPSLYFIDAHISGNDSSYLEKYQVPLIEELEVVLSNLKTSINMFILDDARFWVNNDNPPSDWKHITVSGILDLFKKYKQRVIKHYLGNDRYIIFTE